MTQMAGGGLYSSYMVQNINIFTMSNGDTERVVAPSSVEYEELFSGPAPHIVMYPNEKNYQNDVEFATAIHETEQAIQLGMLPVLSRKGSSGCYFVNNRESVSTFQSLTHQGSPVPRHDLPIIEIWFGLQHLSCKNYIT